MKSFKQLRQKYSIAKMVKMVDDRYGLQAMVRHLTGHWFNPFATLYVNFMCLPFKQALKLPVYIYGSPGLNHVVGEIRFVGGVKSLLAW